MSTPGFEVRTCGFYGGDPNNHLPPLFLKVSGETPILNESSRFHSQEFERVFKLDFVLFSFSAGGYCSQPGGNQRWRVQVLPMPRQVPRAPLHFRTPSQQAVASGLSVPGGPQRTCSSWHCFAVGSQRDLRDREALRPSSLPPQRAAPHGDMCHLDFYLGVEEL